MRGGRRSWRNGGGAAVLVAASLAARSAEAEPTVDVVWDAPRSCPDRSWMLAALDRIVTTPPAEPVRVEGVVREEGEGYAVELAFFGAVTGTRTLHASSCASLSRGAALMIALAFDPQARSLTLEEFQGIAPAPPREPLAEPPPTSSPPRPEAPPVDAAPPPPDRSRSLRAFVLAGASLERAELPGSALGGHVGFGVASELLRIDASFALAPIARAELSERPGAGADFALASVNLRACAVRATPWASLHVCGSARGARVAGRGTGPLESYRQVAYVGSFEPALGLRIPERTMVALEVDGAAVVPFTRPTFTILEAEREFSLFRVSAIGVRLAVGASVRF